MKDYAKRSTFLVLLFVIIFGCKSDTKQIQEERQLARSWASSIALIAQSWKQGATSTQFAIKALERSEQAVGKEATTFQSKQFHAPEAKAVLESLQEISSLAGEIRQMILSEEAGAFDQKVQRLREKAEELKS